ncbi:hypothetical protein EOY42_23160 [Salmonella enterica]|nr:hypothetical protein [Salmonella enterica]EBD7602500.1 hypothetical protein [Salmonella enterica]
MSSKLSTLNPDALPYPKNIILAELIDMLPKIIPPETLLSLDAEINTSDPNYSYKTLVGFINKKLSIKQRNAFLDRMRYFCEDAIYLDTPDDERDAFSREMRRAFSIMT